MMSATGNGKKTKSVPSVTQRSSITTVKFQTSNKKAISIDEFNIKVAQTAFQIFESRGFTHGQDIQDWIEAERIVRESFTIVQ